MSARTRNLLIVVVAILAVPVIANASHRFTDVSDDNTFHNNISWLADADVTRGCNPPANDEFCPSRSVTRQEMAAFMQRLAENRVVDAGTLEGMTASQIIASSGGDGEVDLAGILARLDALEAENAVLQALLAGVTRDGDDLVFTGMNVHLRNGEDSTPTTNSLGNLIVGYNGGSGERTGSHNLVVGDNHTWTSHGGFVTGLNNTISGPWASVSGGAGNTASGNLSSVSGGVSNTAEGQSSSVSAGVGNTAEGQSSSVSGGVGNTAQGFGSSVSGGEGNHATSGSSSVSGGQDNTAGGFHSSVSGGRDNIADGSGSSILGGLEGEAEGTHDTIPGILP